jgi:D-alanine-D-alanine ligase
MKVGILYNLPGEGSSRTDSEMTAELEVLETVEGIKVSLGKSGYEAIPLQCTPESLEAITGCDAIFNLAEGFGNNLKAEPQVAGMLELLKIPYTGSPPEALELCRNKFLSKLVLEREGIPSPRFQLFRNAGDPFRLDFPVIVKPAMEDASIGITADSVARSEKALRRNIHRILKTYNQPALVEEYIPGREINASLIMDGKQARVLPLSEIIFEFPQGASHILGFEAKWVEESPLFQRSIPACPAKLDSKTEAKIANLARKACSVLGVKGYARVDFRLQGDKPFVIEVNPNPCINPRNSGFARSAAADGVDYAHLIGKILGLAIERKAACGKKEQIDSFIYNGLKFMRVKASDTSMLLRWFGDAELTKYMLASDCDTEEKLLARILKSNDEDFVIYIDDIAIGFSSLYGRTGCTAEMSFMIGDTDYLGKNLGSKIAKGILEYGFDQMGLMSIFASVNAMNIYSIRALEGAGFKKIGIRRACSMQENRYLDDVLFDITNEDFIAQNKSHSTFPAKKGKMVSKEPVLSAT